MTDDERVRQAALRGALGAGCAGRPSNGSGKHESFDDEAFHGFSQDDIRPYLAKITATSKSEIVYVAFTIRDADSLRAIGVASTVDPTLALPQSNEPFVGRSVIILPSSSKDRQQAERLKKRLFGVCKTVAILDVPGLAEEASVSDWLGADGTRQELARLSREKIESARSRLSTRSFGDMKLQILEWLVPDWLPKGKLCLIAGNGAVGKSTVACSIAASLSRGWPALGLSYDSPEPVGTLWVTCEEGAEETVLPKLIAARADLNLVRYLDEIEHPNGTRSPFSLENLEELEGFLESHPEFKLVIIDPASGFVGNKDEHKDAELRTMLRPLSELANRTNASVLLIKHLNKSTGANAVARVGGSVAWVNACRAAWIVAPDPNEKGAFYLSNEKSNSAKQPPPRRYRIEGLDSSDANWCLGDLRGCFTDKQLEALCTQMITVSFSDSASDIDINDLLAEGRRSSDETDVSVAAAEFLKDFLGEGPKLAKDCLESGNLFLTETIGEKRSRQWWIREPLKRRLGGESKVQPPGGRGRPYYWCLPNQMPPMGEHWPGHHMHPYTQESGCF